MQKSCLVQLLLFAMVLVVLALSIKRYLSVRGDAQPEAAVATAPVTAAPPSTAPAFSLRASGVNQTVPTPQFTPTPLPTATATPSCRGIEGLTLLLSRPLMTFDTGQDIRGFAVDAQFQYVCAHDNVYRSTTLFKFHRHDGSIAQVRQLPHEPDYAVQALFAGSQFLWVALGHSSEANASLLVAVDRNDLDVRQALPVTDRIVALAEGPDGNLYGVSEGSTVFYTWSRDGVLLRKWSVGGGARYDDMDVVRGALVCVGTDAQGGVIDVVDPATTSLLSRHRYCVPVPGHGEARFSGFGFADETFYLLTHKASVPMVMSYVLADTVMSAYIPSVASNQAQ